MAEEALLTMRGICKYFPGVRALENVDFTLHSGEVHALVGENGAGKSTLIKVLTGVHAKDGGKIAMEGRPISPSSPLEAMKCGISTVYQEVNLCPNLSVAENIFIGREPKKAGGIDWKTINRRAAELLTTLNLNIDVTKTLGSYSVAVQQMIAIARAVDMSAKVLILDEPTSALSSDKAEQLHKIVAELSEKGVAVIYISHKLDEIRKVSDRIVMLTNGQNRGEFYSDEITQEELIMHMGGASEKKERVARDFSENEDMLTITDLKAKGLNGVSLNLKRGEIIGISGLAGSGQQELLQQIYGARKKQKEGIELNGSIAYVSGDRATEGVFQFWNIKNNILVANLDRVKGKLLIDSGKANASAQEWYDKLKFRAEGIESNIMSLSGGNQQKALIARGIASEADIIILNDPTAGVDIGTKQDIYKLLDDTREMGKSIILYSTEDLEMEICDRVYVMRDGYVTKELIGDEIDVPNIVKAAFIETEKKEVKEKKKSAFAQYLSAPWMLPLITLILIFAANVCINPKLMTYAGMRMKISSALPLIFAALGQMFIVMCGDVDMGNGYSIGLVNVIVGIWLTGNPLVGFLGLVIFVGLYMALAALIKIRQIPAIVVTMGAQFVWYGLALIICPTPGGKCPQWLSDFLRIKTPVIPLPIIIAVVTGLACWYLLYRCRYGIVLRGAGNNVQALERSGWSYLLAKVVAYGIAGFFVVLAGMAYTNTCNGADANSSVNYNMMSIATVILGGCDMAGGLPVPVGVVMAAIVMNLINSLLTAMKMNSNYQTAIIGLILIGVLALKFLIHRGERDHRE